MMMLRRALPLTLLAVVSMTACGDNSGGPDLSADAEAGRRIFLDSGCASCHGADGQGGVGPQLAGLWGTEVALDDGTTVIADEAYLRESIVEPSAKKVEGYGIAMPGNDLDDAEVASILAYIEAIGPTGADG